MTQNIKPANAPIVVTLCRVAADDYDSPVVELYQAEAVETVATYRLMTRTNRGFNWETVLNKARHWGRFFPTPLEAIDNYVAELKRDVEDREHRLEVLKARLKNACKLQEELQEKARRS